MDSSLFPEEAILLAASRFHAEYHTNVKHVGPHAIVVELTPKCGDICGTAPEAVEQEFRDMVLLDAVRYKVSKSTQDLRELILGRALYQSCIRASGEGLRETPPQTGVSGEKGSA